MRVWSPCIQTGELCTLTRWSRKRSRRLKGRDDVPHARFELERAPLDQDLAGHDAADVEQIVDEPLEVSGLPVDDARRELELRRGALRGTDDRGGIGHGRERVAQLVPQHRQELVLGAVRLLGRRAPALLRLQQAIALLLRRDQQAGRLVERALQLIDFKYMCARRTRWFAAAGEVGGARFERIQGRVMRRPLRAAKARPAASMASSSPASRAMYRQNAPSIGAAGVASATHQPWRVRVHEV